MARGFTAPVLVGGAAVELYSASAISTGDFDIATARQEEFEEELRKLGFIRPSGPGKATRGWIHPDLHLGFEVVTATLLDGMAAVLSVEDIIADRVGQFASGTARDMLGQARTLFSLFPDADLEYLERRIRHESGGDHGLEILQA